MHCSGAVEPALEFLAAHGAAQQIALGDIAVPFAAPSGGFVWVLPGHGELLLRIAEPNAADAMELAAPLIGAGEFVDLALLDGHYLRRSDAEIFGDPVGSKRA